MGAGRGSRNATEDLNEGEKAEYEARLKRLREDASGAEKVYLKRVAEKMKAADPKMIVEEE